MTHTVHTLYDLQMCVCKSDPGQVNFGRGYQSSSELIMTVSGLRTVHPTTTNSGESNEPASSGWFSLTSACQPLPLCHGCSQ